MDKNNGIKIEDYLNNEKELIPNWLLNYKKGNKFSFTEFLQNRIAFYPGFGNDGQPIKICNQAQYVHQYIYVDYGVPKDKLLANIKVTPFKGYEVYDFIELKYSDLAPNGWVPHHKPEFNYYNCVNMNDAYALLAIFDREQDLDDDYGAQRFAVLFLFADAMATFDALFINNNITPAIMFLADHGFGNNYDRYDNNGILHNLAKSNHCLPEYLVFTRNSTPWDGYQKVQGVLSKRKALHTCGGEYWDLYKKEEV